MVRVAALLVVLSAHGIGGVHFGLPKARAVTELSALFGQPAKRFANTGCRPRYTEVAWGHLYAEFRLGRFSGFRTIETGWPPLQYGTRIVRSDLPRLVTARGVRLGSTFRELRAAYGRLDLVGTGRWRSPDGLTFAVVAGRVVEIKTGTCGDF